MIQLAIHEAINGRDLDYTIARATMEEMMDGTATDIEMATLLTALRMKGETITEITACAEVMREKGAHIEPKGAVMDIVGTGGDEVGSFNISTTAAVVAAAGGVPIAKHGNRSVSSKSGAADVLEELGVRDAFDVRATREAADCLANHIAKEYAAYHQVEIELVHEMFCVVIFGLVGLMKVNPQIEDDVLMKVVEQTLRLDMVPIEPGEG